MAYKRILTIQDISCLGQCSMTVALPVLSACGHETCVLPTAVLSTHTGGFGAPAVTHLHHMLPETIAHWERCGIRFDAILVGYLGSIPAVRETEKLLETLLAPGGVVIVDPAMADHGRLYSGLDEAYAREMGALCRRADVILPNLTEAAMLSGGKCREHADEAHIRRLLEKLGHPKVVLTGVGYQSGQTGAAVFSEGQLRYCFHEKLGKGCHGTGDIFAAAFTGALMQERELLDAVRIAAEFTCRCIRTTLENPAHWYGVKFEPVLPELIAMLK